MSDVDTSRPAVERLIHSGPHTGKIGKMSATLLALLARAESAEAMHDAARAEAARLREALRGAAEYIADHAPMDRRHDLAIRIRALMAAQPDAGLRECTCFPGKQCRNTGCSEELARDFAAWTEGQSDG